MPKLSFANVRSRWLLHTIMRWHQFATMWTSIFLERGNICLGTLAMDPGCMEIGLCCCVHGTSESRFRRGVTIGPRIVPRAGTEQRLDAQNLRLSDHLGSRRTAKANSRRKSLQDSVLVHRLREVEHHLAVARAHSSRRSKFVLVISASTFPVCSIVPGSNSSSLTWP
jgi:hypothetical protein